MTESGARGRPPTAILLRLPAAAGAGIASTVLAVAVMWAGAALFVHGERMWLIPVVVIAPWTQLGVSTLASLAAYVVRPSRRNIALLGAAALTASPALYALGAHSAFDLLAWEGVALVAGGAIIGAFVPMAIAALGSSGSFPWE